MSNQKIELLNKIGDKEKILEDFLNHKDEMLDSFLHFNEFKKFFIFIYFFQNRYEHLFPNYNFQSHEFKKLNEYAEECNTQVKELHQYIINDRSKSSSLNEESISCLQKYLNLFIKNLKKEINQ